MEADPLFPLIRALELGQGRPSVALCRGRGWQIREVVRALDRFVEARGETLRAAPRVVDLGGLPDGSLVLVGLDQEGAVWLNQRRNAITSRTLRLVLWWPDPEPWPEEVAERVPLRRIAPDLDAWTRVQIVLPDGPPEPLLERLRALPHRRIHLVAGKVEVVEAAWGLKARRVRGDAVLADAKAVEASGDLLLLDALEHPQAALRAARDLLALREMDGPVVWHSDKAETNPLLRLNRGPPTDPREPGPGHEQPAEDPVIPHLGAAFVDVDARQPFRWELAVDVLGGDPLDAARAGLLDPQPGTTSSGDQTDLWDGRAWRALSSPPPWFADTMPTDALDASVTAALRWPTPTPILERLVFHHWMLEAIDLADARPWVMYRLLERQRPRWEGEPLLEALFTWTRWATGAWRELADESVPTEDVHLLHRLTLAEARLAMGRVREALAILQDVPDPGEKAWRWHRALARAHRCRGAFDEARQAYAEARELARDVLETGPRTEAGEDEAQRLLAAEAETLDPDWDPGRSPDELDAQELAAMMFSTGPKEPFSFETCLAVLSSDMRISPDSDWGFSMTIWSFAADSDHIPPAHPFSLRVWLYRTLAYDGSAPAFPSLLSTFGPDHPDTLRAAWAVLQHADRRGIDPRADPEAQRALSLLHRLAAQDPGALETLVARQVREAFLGSPFTSLEALPWEDPPSGP